MTQNADALEVRLAALEARMAEVEAKVKPANICIFEDKEYSAGSLIKQVDGHIYKCNPQFNGTYQWDFQS